MDSRECCYITEDMVFCHDAAVTIVNTSCVECGDEFSDYPACAAHQYDMAELLHVNEDTTHDVTWLFQQIEA